MGPPPLRLLAACGGFNVVAGLERLTFEVLRTLADRGAAVHCIVNSWDNERIVALAEALGASWSVGRYWEGLDRHARSPVKLARMTWDVLVTSTGMLRDAGRFRASAVLLPELASVLRNAPALLLLRALGVRVVLRVGNAPEPGGFYARLWRGIAPLLDTAVANSRFGARRLAETGFPEAKIAVVHNAVARRPAGAGGDTTWIRARRTILCVGQIAPFKGTHLAVEAVLALLDEGYDVQGAVVGRQPDWPEEYRRYAAELEEKVRAAGRGDRFRFLGEREDVPQILAAGHLLAAPILQQETFGNVVLEALTEGLPAVVFPHGGLPELVEHEVTGWVCGEATLEGLLAGLRHFLDDAEAHRAAARAARERFADPEGPYGRRAFERGWSRVFGLAEPS